MPHAFGKKKRTWNLRYADLKRVQVATHIAFSMGGAQYQMQPHGTLYHIRLETFDGLTMLVRVRTARRKTKRANRFSGFDLYCLNHAVRNFKDANPDAPVRAITVSVWGNSIDCCVHGDLIGDV